MALYRVKFMNHIVETYLIEAPDEEAAWATDAWQVEEMEPEDWDCTLCEVHDVEEVEDVDA